MINGKQMNNPWEQAKNIPQYRPADWSKPNPWPIANAIKAPIQPVEAPSPYDAMSQNDVLMEWQKLKDDLAKAKEAELDMRKYIVKRAFPQATEGMNTADLGNGYQLKANVKYNYKLEDNKKVEDGLDKITKIGNQGQFVADRLVSWTPNFLLTEFRALQEQANEGSLEAKEILKIINNFIIITDAAPTLIIKEPKSKK